MIKYKIGKDTGRVIKINGSKTEVIYGGKISSDLGKTYHLDHWCMSCFRDLTTEEYEQYVKKYTYNDLKDKPIAVNCNTKEKSVKFQNFIKKYIHGATEYFESYGEEICYSISGHNMWHASISFYEDDNYKIIDFDQVNFNDVKEESYKMKYKLIKTLSLEEALKCIPCQQEFEKAVKKFEFFEIQKWTEENEKYVIEQSGWIRFLVDNGFIVKIKEEYLHKFSAGDKITFSDGDEIVMYQISTGIGMFFDEKEHNRYVSDKYSSDSTYDLKTLKIGLSSKITHINGKEI